MPFDTDADWPAPLKTIFEVSRATLGTLEHRYYGPYDKLLNYCFNGFDYFVAPQAPPRNDTTETVDFVVYLVVMDKRRQPVFLIEVKDDSHLEAPSKRVAADLQMRARFDDLLYKCPLPILHGLSVMGTTMRVYSGDAKAMTLDPPRVPTSPDHVLDRNHLEGAWNVDILSARGFAKMKEIVSYIKTTSPDLNVTHQCMHLFLVEGWLIPTDALTQDASCGNRAEHGE
ncbi:hypothetical protein R3P38DRAFT_3114171 [Favolaschia claudopus]|uniref:Uncharacterized protein n=1 Tax=Favolaschia claudopus TaxID=2862362 RepID=A0AAV9ZGN8_9AGAR